MNLGFSPVFVFTTMVHNKITPTTFSLISTFCFCASEWQVSYLDSGIYSFDLLNSISQQCIPKIRRFVVSSSILITVYDRTIKIYIHFNFISVFGVSSSPFHIFRLMIMRILYGRIKIYYENFSTVKRTTKRTNDRPIDRPNRQTERNVKYTHTRTYTTQHLQTSVAVVSSSAMHKRCEYFVSVRISNEIEIRCENSEIRGTYDGCHGGNKN